MTLLTKTIRRELPGQFDRRSWVIELTSWGVRFRAKRTRRVYDITWASVWNKAMQIEVARVKLEKAERRKAKKAGVR